VKEDSTQAFTFSAGILIGVLGFGVDISNSTGYSSDTTLETDFSQQGYACGSTNYPLRTDPGPSAVVADEHSSGNS